MKVVILCGGKGVRLNDSLNFVPKGMVKIGHRPLLWHVMKIYAQYGFNEFVLALGSGSETIRDYFIHYDENINDITLVLGEGGKIEYSTQNREEKWKITFVETGEESGTGARIFRCKKYLNDGDFLITYSDCLADVNIKKLIDFHNQNNKVATISGILPPFRYGEFIMENNVAVKYTETSRLKSHSGFVNGGFMILQPKIFDYLTPYNECVLEKDVFKQLAEEKQISVFEHSGFWHCLDNDREYKFLNQLTKNNSEFWLKKND